MNRTPEKKTTGGHRAPGTARLGLAVIAVLALGGITYAVARGGGTDRSSTAHPGPITSAVSAGPYGPHYDGLAQRRRDARVPTMMTTMNSTVHVHPVLKVYVNGRRLIVPANIGIDPREDPMRMAGLHTHDTSGTIHVEGVPGARLEQFFAIWGVPFSSRRLGQLRSDPRKPVRMWVNGKPSAAFGRLKLVDGQRVVISFGARDASAPAS